MNLVSQFALVLAQTFLWTIAAFFAVLGMKLVGAGFAEGGMLTSESAGKRAGAAEPERIAALIATVAAAVTLAAETLSGLSSAAPRFGEPHDLLIWLTGGGQLSYLLGKSFRLN